jgi:DUF4097 and DUF4098 domain-containing protein YvlB
MARPMRLPAFLAALMGSALGMAGCGIAEANLGSRTTVVETRRLEPGGTFHLENVNGGVEVTTWDEPRVRIEADKAAGSQAALEALRVEVRGEGTRVDVETHHPHLGFFRSAARVNYRVSVPKDARVEVETTNGAISIFGTAGAVRTGTTNGSIEVADASGAVEAGTTNGSVRAQLSTVEHGASYRFTTTNGSVRLTVPEEVDGTFKASTVNGGISTDLPLDVDGKFGPKHAHGKVGDGSARFHLETVNGAISIKKR